MQNIKLQQNLSNGLWDSPRNLKIESNCLMLYKGFSH